MAVIMMAAYTNYRRDPRVKREAEALVEAGHRVVFLASRQPGEPSRETIAGVEIIKTIGLKNKRTSVVVCMLDVSVHFPLPMTADFPPRVGYGTLSPSPVIDRHAPEPP